MNARLAAAVEEHAVVLPLHHKRAKQAEPFGYQMTLFDGSLALKVDATPDPDAAEALDPAGSLVEQTGQVAAASRTAVIVARALLEVLSGWRPASQLSRWTSHALQQDLERRAPRRPTGSRLVLRRIKVSEPAAGIAEVCALADDPVQQRVRVIALRLEDRDGSWIVTRLQAG